MSHVRCRQISSANLGFALPENILIPPVVLIAVQRRKFGWGGWIRTNECRFQRPVPYHLATPQYLFICLQFLESVKSGNPDEFIALRYSSREIVSQGKTFHPASHLRFSRAHVTL